MNHFPYDKKSKKSILSYAKKLTDKSLSDLGINQDKFEGKGKLGLMVEKGYFCLDSGNKAEQDFRDAELELKVTGIKIDNKTKKYKAKERLVCSMINYYKISKEEWDGNSFIEKCKNILFVFYLYEEKKYKNNPEEIKFFEPMIFTFDCFQKNLIKKDWKIIKQKVLDGKAHELSEGNTDYLGAATKGMGGGSGKDFTRQPYSNCKAKRRAYSLKTTFLNRIIDTHLNKIPNKYKEPIFETIKKILNPYKNLSRSQICKKLDIKEKFGHKSFNRSLVAKMLDNETYPIPELERITNNNATDDDCIEVKTIVEDKNQSIKESMSFPAFNPMEIIKEEWNESTFFKKLNKKFLFVLFERDDNKNYIFRDSFVWNIPHKDMEEAERVWKKTKDQIENHKTKCLPKQKESKVAHVRPHGKNKDDKVSTPDGSSMTKQSFWLNNKYIAEQIKNMRRNNQ